MWRLVVCSGCDGKGDALTSALNDALPEVQVDRTSCLLVCSAPVTMAAQGEERATYVFSGLGPDDLDDIVRFTREYEASPGGWIEDARPLGRLRFALVTRVPAMSITLTR